MGADAWGRDGDGARGGGGLPPCCPPWGGVAWGGMARSGERGRGVGGVCEGVRKLRVNGSGKSASTYKQVNCSLVVGPNCALLSHPQATKILRTRTNAGSKSPCGYYVVYAIKARGIYSFIDGCRLLFVRRRPPRIADRFTVSLFTPAPPLVGQCLHVFTDFMTRRAHEVQIGRHSCPHDRKMYPTIDAFSYE